jgi:hypothetical protein
MRPFLLRVFFFFQLFTGNTDRNTVVKNVLNPPIRAKLIRFIPTTYHNWKVLRVEAYGSVEGKYTACHGLTLSEEFACMGLLLNSVKSVIFD